MRFTLLLALLCAVFNTSNAQDNRVIDCWGDAYSDEFEFKNELLKLEGSLLRNLITKY